MKIKKTLKLVGGAILSYGITGMIGNVINSTTPKSDGKIKKTCIGVSGVILGLMLTDKVIKFYEKSVDEVAKGVEKSVENGELS